MKNVQKILKKDPEKTFQGLEFQRIRTPVPHSERDAPERFSPREMGESLVGFSHTVDVFALRISRTFFIVGGEQFSGKFLCGRLTFFIADGTQHPADGEGLLTDAVHLHRNLIGRTADALGTNFDVRLDVFNRLSENFDTGFVGDFLFDFSECAVEDVLRNAFFAVIHQAVNEFAGEQGTMNRISDELLAACSDFTHFILLININDSK